MLAVAAQLDLIARLLAVIAAVLPVRAVRRHHALTHRMRALLFDAGHDAPPPRHSTTPAGAPPRPAVPVGLDESVIWDRKWRARILPDQCPSGSSFRLRLYPFQEGNIDPERPPKTGGRLQHRTPRRGHTSTIGRRRSGLFVWPRAWPRLVQKPQQPSGETWAFGATSAATSGRVICCSALWGCQPCVGS